MNGFCWIMLVPGGVLIKLLSCCLETKLYNQWIKNSFLGGNREGRVGRMEVMLWDAGSFPPWHGTANSSLSTLETFLLVFFFSSLLKSAILVLLLEAAQRPGIKWIKLIKELVQLMLLSLLWLSLLFLPSPRFGWNPWIWLWSWGREQLAAGVTQGVQSTWTCRIPVFYLSTPSSGCKLRILENSM